MIYDLFHYIDTIKRTINNYFTINYYRIRYGKRIKIGKNVKFRRKLLINIAKNGYLEIGNNNFFNNYCSINCHKKIIIGNNNLFGEEIKIYDHNHIFNNKTINFKKSFKSNEITIGNNNWFGSNSIILSKSKVGNNCVIGAAVVLNEPCEDNTLIKCIKQEHEKIIYKQEKK